MKKVNETITAEKTCRVYKEDLIEFIEKKYPELLDEPSSEGRVWYTFTAYNQKYPVAKDVASLYVTRTRTRHKKI
tara:strand:+ start:684 stop:908 length:225 start_codon:yes stop_codon:yes gene_type:complete